MSPPKNEPATADTDAGRPRTYTTFRLGDDLFGTAANVVKEVTALPPLTPIPHAPAAVRGYVNLRGHIVLVVDLRRLLQREVTAPGPECRLIVFQPELGDAFGVLVERIGDMVTLTADRIEMCHGAAADAAGLPEEELICGVGKLDRELLTVLDARRLLPYLENTAAFRGVRPARQDFVPGKEISP